MPFRDNTLASSYIHILCNRQVGAEGNFLINCTDAYVLGILWRFDGHSFLVTLNIDFAAVFFLVLYSNQFALCGFHQFLNADNL